MDKRATMLNASCNIWKEEYQEVRSAVDVLLSGGPMSIVVLEVHNPSPKIKHEKGWGRPQGK